MKGIQKRDYYYLVAGLPNLIFEQGKPPFSTLAFRQELENHLHPDDYALAAYLFLPADNRNLLGLLLKNEFQWDEGGLFSREEMEASLRDQQGPLPYMSEFIQAYQADAPLTPNMSWENQLTQSYYDYVLGQTEGFLHEWLAFDRDLHNIRAALAGRRHSIGLDGQLIGAYRLTEAARSSSVRDFGLSGEYPFIQRLLVLEDEPDLREREEETDILRWEYIDELNTFNYFTIEVLLGYLLKLSILERWAALSDAGGRKAFDNIVQQLKQSFEFPKEFSLS